jgi:hypothetical protein
MPIVVLVLTLTLLASVTWGLVVAVREVWVGLRPSLVRPRFDLVDLLLLMAVVAMTLATFRVMGNSPYLAPVLLLIPLLSPLLWLGKFLLEDARLQARQRRDRRAAIASTFELPDSHDEAEPTPVRKRRRLVPLRNGLSACGIRLSAFSLGQTPLHRDDD